MRKPEAVGEAYGERYRGKRVLILGLGNYPEGSGAAATRFFVRHGARVTVTDAKSREELRGALARLRAVRATYVLGGHRSVDVDRADLVVRNPGVRADAPPLRRARRRGIPVVSDVSLFFRASPAPIVGVTGTRGKSTTSALLAEMLRRSGRRVWLGGNIKRSPLAFLGKVRAGDIVVLELSSWMLETLDADRRSPPIAVFTNLLRDHLNTYPGMRAYARAKSAVFRHQDADGVAVLSRDDAWTRRLGREAPGRRVWTSLAPVAAADAVFVRGGWIRAREQGRESRIARFADVALPGTHNLANALSAAAAARAAGASTAAIRAALRGFRGLPDRQEPVGTVRGVLFVNDTTATTPDATIAALRTFADRRVVLIAGGTDKALVFGPLAREIERRRRPRGNLAGLVLLPGSATGRLAAALARLRHPSAPRERPIAASSMREAVDAASALARRGDIVLLSPGAASFGLFRNEFDRGERFIREVRRLRRVRPPVRR